VIQAVLLGAAAQAALLLSGLAVYVVKVPRRVVGALAGYGAGALLGAIAFDLIPQGEELSSPEIALWLLVGAAVFVVADWFVETRLGGESVPPPAEADGGASSDAGEGQGSGGGPLGIVVGAVVDGVPESLIFGIQLASGAGISVAFLAAVFVSNIPQALAPSVDLAASGWKPLRMAMMWGVVVIACGVTAGLGFALADAIGLSGARAATFASGGLLAMMTNSLMPFAFERGGALAGIMTVVGFAVSVASAA
jgi:zinc transporter, ZIP family